MARAPVPTSALRARYEQRHERLTARRSVRATLVSLAGLMLRPVTNETGDEIGRVADVVARWDDDRHLYPAVTGLVVRIGRRRAWVAVDQVARIDHRGVGLRSSRLDLRDFSPRDGEVELFREVVDHQLVDTDGARVVRAADLYLAEVAGSWALVGVDVGFASILRRLGPARFRAWPTPDKVIDWASIHRFGRGAGNRAQLQAADQGLRRLQPGELADLLEDLGRQERRELLADLSPEQAADALEEMQPEELSQLLRESDNTEAGELLGRMEPDEAAEALRQLDDDERGDLLAAMPTRPRAKVEPLLDYAENTAGGVMTSLYVTARPSDTVGAVRGRLREQREHDQDLAGVIVVDAAGRLVDDLTTTELFLAELTQTVDELLGPPVAGPHRRRGGDRGGGRAGGGSARRLGRGGRRRATTARADPARRPPRRPAGVPGRRPLPPEALMSDVREETNRRPQVTTPATAALPSAPPTRPGRHRSFRRRLLTVLALMGPGIIAANAGNDAGGIATYASAGAQFGYRTLFAMLLVTVGLVVVQEMCARLGAYTGEGLGALIREQFSIRVTAFALLALVVANVGLVVSEFAGIAAAMELLGVTRYISVPIAAVATWALVVFGSYRYAERVFLVLSIAFLAYPVSAVLSHPHLGQAATELVYPHFLGQRTFILLVVALIGTTITPYMQFYVAAAVADRGIGPAEYPAERLDTVFGSIFCNLISICIIVATAAAITVRAPLGSAKQAAEALSPVAGRFASQLFALGLLGASALAAVVVPLSTAYAISEATGAERSVSKNFRQAPLFLGLFTGQVVVGASLALIPGNLIHLLIRAQVLNGVITPILLTYVLVLANRRSLLGRAANGPVFRVVATVTVAVIGLLSATVVVQGLGIG